jgi:hypothetical protein
MSSSVLYVPDLPTLYEQVRGTAVQPRFPLSEGEIRSLQGPFDPRFKQFGIKQFTVDETLHMMDNWIDRNVRAMDAQRREAERCEREARKHAVHGSDRSFINQLLSEAKPHGPKHKKPGQRYMNANRPKREEKPKKDQGNKRH